MESRWIPLIIGGFLPALFYGLAGVLQKASARAGGSAPLYLIGFGLATCLTGLVYRQVAGDSTFSAKAALWALLAGTLFAAGAGLISSAIIRYDASISQLSPLYNMNILVTVALGVLIFAEWNAISTPRLLAGTIVILFGGWLVSSA
jgi:glucose uptake protein GlcU